MSPNEWKRDSEWTNNLDQLKSIQRLLSYTTQIRSMKLASHNSYTYFKVKGFWKKLIGWTAKCQSKSIREQYELGARLFDLRIWYDKNLNMEFRHGIIKYDVEIAHVLCTIDYLNQKNDCYVRVILEETKSLKKKSYVERNENLFRTFCEGLEKNYPNIKFFGGMRKYDWKILYEFKEPYPDIVEYNSSGLWPWLSAFLYNKKNMKKEISGWGMFDFI